MRKTSLLVILLFNIVMLAHAQILKVNVCIQEQSEWCWAGVSQCVLDYYGTSVKQCEIADYTRSVSTWHNFGPTSCCKVPGGLCNYWNYNWGYSGSIQDILTNFAFVGNYGVAVLSLSLLNAEILKNRPPIIRWKWGETNDGHFIVAYGVEGQTVYYMDPWFGEGAKFADYDWIEESNTHTWTHTNVMTVSPSTSTGKDVIVKTSQTIIFPNPSNTGIFQIENLSNSTTQYRLYTIDGKLQQEGVFNNNSESLSVSQKGIYILKLIGKNVFETHKLIVK